MIGEMNLDNLSRQEYINLILMIIYSFKYNYEKFSEREISFLKGAIEKSIYWEEDTKI